MILNLYLVKLWSNPHMGLIACRVLSPLLFLFAQTFRLIYIYIYTYVYIYIYTHICIYIYIYRCVYIYIYIHMAQEGDPKDLVLPGAPRELFSDYPLRPRDDGLHRSGYYYYYYYYCYYSH